jgi:hypothetical protein
MKSIDKLASQTIAKVQTPVAGPANARGTAGNRDQVDAINQLFAELLLAYHNQYHKAFAAAGSEALAKKYWLSALAEFSPEVIRRATRLVVQNNQFLPSLATMVATCENGQALFGLPTAEAAYREACLAPEPKHLHQWSHAAVYFAAQATGWFALANEVQSAVLPLFEYNYAQCCRRVLHGELLELPVIPALPASVPAPLSTEDNRKKLKALRAQFDL